MKKHFHFLILFFLVFTTVNTVLGQEKNLTHKVKEGETIRSISLQYKITPYELVRLNPDMVDPPKEGSVIIIPTKKDAVEISETIVADTSKIVLRVDSSKKDTAVLQEVKEYVKPKPHLEEGDKSFGGHIYHKVKAKETLYGLSKLYGVEIKDIYNSNPKLVDGLKLGMILSIPDITFTAVPEHELRDTINFILHVVEPKETQWGLCHKYGISQEQLLESNPQVSTGLLIGDSLWFPKKEIVSIKDTLAVSFDYTFYEVLPKDTKYGISRKYKITIDELIKANPIIDSVGLKIGMVLRVPRASKQLYDTNKVASETFSNLPNDAELTHKQKIEELDKFDINNVIDVVIMLPFYLKENKEYMDYSKNPNKYKNLKDNEIPKLYSKSKIGLNFYNGAMMAIDSLKRMGLSVRLRVFDTENSIETLESIFVENDFSGVDVVIGPLYTANAEFVADKLKYDNILVVSPLSKKMKLDNRYNLIQAMPTDYSTKSKVIRQVIAEKRDTSQILIFGGNRDSLEIDFVKNRLTTYVDSSIVQIYNAPENLVDRDTVFKMMKPDKDNIVIIASESNVLVTDVITAMNQVTDSLPNRAYALSRPKILDQLDSKYLNNIHLAYPEDFHSDISNPKIQKFEADFRIKYRTLPDRFAYRGFDVTYDMLFSLAKNSNLEVGIMDNNHHFMQGRFDYARQPFGGYFNRGVFLLRYNDWKLIDISE